MPKSGESAPEDRPGTIVDGKYALVSLVGEGGMAQVWRALTYGAHGIRRTIALKRLHEHFSAYPEVIEMFVEEARVGARLRHPNVVQIHDFGVDEFGRHYLITEWVEGMHLGQFLSSYGQAKASWPIITAIGIEVLRALDAAHTSRADNGEVSPVLHRDVSPPNILLDVLGVTKLADFGMARAMDRGRITRPDMVKGKLSYIAPEMAVGEDPTPQSDLYSLGIVLWEAYTGSRLFDGATDVEVLQRVREPNVPLLARRAPELPIGLSMTVQRALERDRSRRFPSAVEMLDSLLDVLRAHPSSMTGAALARAVQDAQARLGRLR